MPTNRRQSDTQSPGQNQPVGDHRLSIAESAEAIAGLKTFPDKVRSLKKYTRTPKRTDVDRLLREMERHFETANLYDDEVIDGLVQTGEKIKVLLNEKPQPHPAAKPPAHRSASTSPEGEEIPPEVESLRTALTADYDKATTNLTWYGITETAEDGRKYYTADYDGRTEKDPNDSRRRPCPDAHNFSGEQYEVPTLEKIMQSLTPAQAALYNEYKEKGLEPRLQLTPLAMKLRTMAGKLDSKKAEINAKAGRELIQIDTFIWDAQESGEIDERTLLYEPQIVEASPDGKELITKNGLTKSQLIKKYGGWLVEIVPMKPELKADADKQTKEITKDGKTEKVTLTNAEKTAMYMREARTGGEWGLGYENYLTAQMNALATDTPTPLEQSTYTVLPESSLTKNKKIVAGAFWLGDQVGLDGNGSSDQRSVLRCRRSVRVYVKP